MSQALPLSLQTFGKRLQCNTQCARKELTDLERETCRQQLCEGFNPKEFKYEETEEESQYSAYYEDLADDDAAEGTNEEAIEVLPRSSSV